MSIVGGLFKAAGLGHLVDSLEAQGITKASETGTGLIPQMFIGGGGIKNLGESGVAGSEDMLKLLENAQKDWFKLPAESWMTKYADSGVAFDPVANKAMLEISDANVQVKKGIDLNKIPAGEQLGFDEVFNAETLKKAYPDIGDIKIGFKDDANSPRLAGFDATTDTVYFNRANPDWKPSDTKSIMLHEVQHYVQGKELFTKGEGFTQVLQQNNSFQDAIGSLDKAIASSPAESVKFAAANKGLGFTSDSVSEAIGSLSKRDGLSVEKALEKAFREQGMAKDRSKIMAEKLILKSSNFPSLNAALMAKEASSEAYKQSINDYMKVAGEVFARQTQERADMGLAERLANPAMRGIESNPTNKAYGITLDNMTSPMQDSKSSVQDAYFVPEWKLKEQTRNEQEQGFSRKLNNPIKLADGSRLSGFTSNSQEVFYGYDKNGELFTIRKEYVKPEDIISSRDSNKTAEMIKNRLPLQTQNTEYADVMQSSIPAPAIPQSSIPGLY